VIQVCVGDILNIESGIIVHGCNNCGVMRSGLAKQVRYKYPEAYDEYLRMFQGDGLKIDLGEISHIQITKYKIIVNAITQDGFGYDGKKYVSYDAIELSFSHVVELASKIEDEYGKKLDIVFPKIGCGLGGGNWNIVEKIIDETVPDRFCKRLYIHDDIS
jgi:O-acetyl-ADP-ribose deacetylase (regulator of RNase III)